MGAATTGELLARLKLAFPRERIERATVETYMRYLSDLDPDALEAAVDEAITTGSYFPTIAALREAAAEHQLAIPSEGQALVQIAARMSWGRTSRTERPDDPPAVHPIVREALDLVGGFAALRDGDRPGVVRGQFSKVYRDLRAVAIRDVQARPALAAGPQRTALPTVHGDDR